jgi:cytochrome c-type biogenesis protein
VGETFAGLVTDGPLLVAAAVAALVGLISFASPCVLPLVPGYLSYVTGLVGSGAAAPGRASGAVPPAHPSSPGGTATAVRTDVPPRARMVLGAALFVLGFTVVFVAFGAAFGGLGRLMVQHADLLNRVFGVITIVVGLGFLGRLPLLQRTKRISARPVAGLAGAPLLGIVFGLGWTPCLGPTLSAVYSLAFSEATATRGAILSVAYCIGLGVPFVLVALGARWAVGATTFLRRHARSVTRFGGAVLVIVGLLLLTGAWTEMMGWLRSWLAATGFGESAL